MTDERLVPISPNSFTKPSLHELCFEDALKEGAKLSESTPAKDWKETSIRFRIDGLYKWLEAYADDHEFGSVFYLLRDSVWQWASFCTDDLTIASVTRDYRRLRAEITDNTDFTDLADRMDGYQRLVTVGWGGRPVNVLIPFKVSGILRRSAEAVGVSFSVFYQLGSAWCLSRNREGSYRAWVEGKFQPVFDEVMGRAKARVKDFAEVKQTLDYRLQQGK